MDINMHTNIHKLVKGTHHKAFCDAINLERWRFGMRITILMCLCPMISGKRAQWQPALDINTVD